MEMLTGEQIVGAALTDWRKLAQGLHARYRIDDFGTGARFLAAVGEAGDALGHHPRVSIGPGYVDLKLSSDDAVYRDDEGTEHVVEWVTQQDVDLARRISELAADRSPLICQGQSLNLYLRSDIHKWDLLMLHWTAWERGVKSLYYCRSKSVQRAGFAGVEADNTRKLPVKPLANDSDEAKYDECLSCQ